jgi:hypothetical protein
MPGKVDNVFNDTRDDTNSLITCWHTPSQASLVHATPYTPTTRRTTEHVMRRPLHTPGDERVRSDELTASVLHCCRVLVFKHGSTKGRRVCRCLASQFHRNVRIAANTHQCSTETAMSTRKRSTGTETATALGGCDGRTPRRISGSSNNRVLRCTGLECVSCALVEVGS